MHFIEGHYGSLERLIESRKKRVAAVCKKCQRVKVFPLFSFIVVDEPSKKITNSVRSNLNKEHYNLH